MPDINFNALASKSDWANALQSILDESTTAIHSQDDDKKIALQQQLKTFIKRSPTMADDLDDIALRTIDDLTSSVVDDAIAAIAQRNQELKNATKGITDAAKEAKKDANAIQLKNVIDVLDRTKSAVETLKSLEQNLADPDKDLLAKIGTTTAAIEELLNLVKAKSGD